MPPNTPHESVIKDQKALATTKSFLIALIATSVLLTGFATVTILVWQDRVTDRVVDCVVPTGDCYKSKILHNQLTTDAEVSIIVNYCINRTPTSLEETRKCVTKELDRNG